ncbi:dethiobiotin synthase [Spirochaeta thermophila]|uniref:ATP-dependent dethiobiotin synthetase BioD n=1 Tax=Winmispira thermophila (strain ATCC 49972 / DSM 6192 / RI 19.B1) TaxID=665571 RepID=E0RU49_WINT6|nr:dethiobiotin synthase [Spirochaeta thermophila]ADN02270.1 dethiobiotin synthetase 2 [Spirochaeta thermophila DSM 6192]
MERVIAITGIDTGIGKTLVTGLLARSLTEEGRRVITAKAVQTGCEAPIAEDIALHRRIMGIPFQEEDLTGLTCPYCYRLPASPHLAAREEGETIDPPKIAASLSTLAERWELVLVEGAGGVCVPLTDRYTFLSFCQEYRLSVIVVTSARLGSINHTCLTIEALQRANIEILGMVYNLYPPTHPRITEDSYALFASLWPEIPLVRLPQIEGDGPLKSMSLDPLVACLGSLV